MGSPSWFVELDQIQSSYLLLATVAALCLAAAVLFQVGLLGYVLGLLGRALRVSTRRGFLLWERLLAWASWPVFLVIVFVFVALGEAAGASVPGLKVFCGMIPLFMGATACLAYMFIDLERYEVGRGYKAVHNPLKGQELAVHLARHGERVHVPLLVAATIGMIGGFALLNQGLYETIGRTWYKAGDEQGQPVYVDFLTYALINLLGIVDVLDLAQSNHFVRAAVIHSARWPAATLLAGYRMFFTLVLLQQIFASLRQGKLLAETITDFWSPHQPIHECARNALPQYGAVAIEPLLVSLRAAPSLTKEQRDQLPLTLATIGPSTIPALVRHLDDPHEHVRAIAAAALGRLHALDAVPLLVPLCQDPSDVVRQTVVEALGGLGGAAATPARRHEQGGGPKNLKRRFLSSLQYRWLFRWRKRGPRTEHHDPVELAVTALRSALNDACVAVRTQAAVALGRIGTAATAVAPELIALLKDTDETVRCQAAEALGKVGGEEAAAAAALAELLHDASGPVKASAAQALGTLKSAAGPAAAALVSLLQDREEAVRTAAAEAIARVGPLNDATTDTLVEGLASRDTVVRAQTAEALGTIGAAAAEAAPALVEAMADGNDHVRAKAVEALGKIGEAAADAAVPGLVRALRDPDNWVGALAAEALGQMGESADGAIPALIRSLGHFNAQVRANAAEALGKMGAAAVGARTALEKASQEEDAGVRGQATRALGTIGNPTPTSTRIVLAGLHDADPLVRAAAVESVGQWAEPGEAVLGSLMPLLEDANDRVKVEVTRILPRLAGATPAVIDGLCRRLLEDDSVWVQVHAALALGQLGPAAAAAGGPLLRAIQTGEENVREQAMRAMAMIQPPEILAAFASGLMDANADIRKVASGGWMKAEFIPEEIVPALVAALRDPEVQVRANAANALARLDPLPAEAIPLLIACTGDASDGLRMNAALALKAAPPSAVAETMRQLLEDANLRIRLIAAGALLPADPNNPTAAAALVEALGDPALRVRKAAVELVESLGMGGGAFLENVNRRAALEEDQELRDRMVRLGKQLGARPEAAAQGILDTALAFREERTILTS